MTLDRFISVFIFLAISASVFAYGFSAFVMGFSAGLGACR